MIVYFKNIYILLNYILPLRLCMCYVCDTFRNFQWSCSAGCFVSVDIVLSRGFTGVGEGSELPVCACWPGAQCECADEWVGVQWAADLPCLLRLLQPLPSSSGAPTNQHYSHCSHRYTYIPFSIPDPNLIFIQL